MTTHKNSTFPRQYGSMSSVNRAIKNYTKSFGLKPNEEFCVNTLDEGCIELQLVIVPENIVLLRKNH